MKRTRKLFLWGITAVLAGWLFTQQAHAVGTTLTVNATGDLSDLDPGDGVCSTIPTVGNGQCSLRAAIEELNALGSDPSGDPHRIHFDIAGTGPFTISPNTPLPRIIVPIEIDGETQPGASCPTLNAPANLQIVLDGSNTWNSGFELDTGSDGSLIRGLVIGNFNDGIFIRSHGNRIACNHIGVAVDGISGMGNEYGGIVIVGNENIVGGQSAASKRNVISDNGDEGIKIASGDNNIIRNNFIGTIADGLDALPNDWGIIVDKAHATVIGGSAFLARNVISGNDHYGLHLSGSQNSYIMGNYIGVASDGVTPLGNGEHGIDIPINVFSSIQPNPTIGGVSSGQANIIAFNQGDGINARLNIHSSTPSAYHIRGNKIYDNSDVGIRIGPLNEDATDPNEQNYPILAAQADSNYVDASLDSQPGQIYQIDFYRNDSCDPSGFGEGQDYIGTVELTTDALGFAATQFSVAGLAASGDYITATATDVANENTSEFSNCVQVSELTFVVDTISDLGDSNPGDGLCDVVGATPYCSLRAAIEEFNSVTGGPFRISFDIPGNGPHVIAPATAFDHITKPVIIDGTTQPESHCALDGSWLLPDGLPANLLVVLDGSNVPDGNGLTLAVGSGGSEIRGLVIGGFPAQGIYIASNDNLITCNHIGLDVVGTAVFGNGLNGILVTGDDNRIGGLYSTARNVISGNSANGILLLNDANENRVWGNFIGTDQAGVTAVPNSAGIRINNSHNNEIGGNGTSKGNLIAGNSLNGLQLENSASTNLIQYNIIGLNNDGNPLGNGANGIYLKANVTATQIEANTVAHNGESGIVLLATATENPIYGNSIYTNGELGIDLNNDGLTANDLPNDPDTGANNLQNFPDMRSANPLTGDISGTMESAPSTEYRLDFYRSTTCDPSDYGEGEDYLGMGTVTTDATGVQTFTVTLGGFALNDFITATATDPNGNTSEFSVCFPAGGSPPA
ncbi:NosD domain-containing protein [Candidatus Leptofilum sp.]|uniref:NosD domain-containing protein n=1 Tax=Candidatus Leptofilum sp. TaxID=3241576 RepID=UPI003B5BD1F0